MSEVARFIILVELIVLLIIIVLTWIYGLPIIFIQRFHTTTNILTFNVCFVSFLCSLHWIIYYIFYGFYPSVLDKYTASCPVVPYFQTLVSCLVTYALLMITINRFFSVIYPNKTLFKRHRWSFISIIIQWIVAIILPLPYFMLSFKKCVDLRTIPFWFGIYRLFIIVILPSILSGIFNAFIFFKVKASSKQLYAETMKISPINSNGKCLCSRDISLLKHMLFIHIIFVIGWLPSSILFIIKIYITIPFSVVLLVPVLPSLSLLINILDLFLFNHELRQYVKEQFMLKISL